MNKVKTLIENEERDVVIWVISDTHFYHYKLCEYTDRPIDFTERIICNWQKVVKQTDVVVVLGDVILGKNGTLGEIMAQLPGAKILTVGNHDHKSFNWYRRKGFATVCDEHYHLWKGLSLVFSHEPVIPLLDGVDFNIHGHFHQNRVRIEKAESNSYYQQHKEKYILVEIESTLSPVLLETIMEGKVNA